MSVFHCGLFRFLGGHGARNFCNRNESNSAKRTSYIFGRSAARFCRALALTLVLALALGLAIGFVGAGDAAAGDKIFASNMNSVSVFGASELKVKKAKTFHRWDKMLERYAVQEARLAKGRGRLNEKRGSKLWDEVINGLKGLDPVTQIKEVNNYFNAFTYQSDAKNYAIQDYWATPYQFLSRAKGDCEDFAAAKYLALRALGFHSNQLRLVVGYDRARGGAHTVVLVVVDGRVLMLDIGDNTVVEMSGVKLFDPFYSVTESEGWMHMKRA